MQALVAKADVLVQNLAPGAAARLGLSEEALRPTHPRLILCDISGYGASGPYRDRKAYDLLIQSEAGFLSVTGTPEDQVKAGISIADIAAGQSALTGILAALIQRGITGRGQHLDISMLEAMAEWMGFPMYYAMDGAPPPPRAGAAHATIFPYGPFLAGDGRAVMFGLQNEREWTAFCTEVLHQPALATDPRFNANAKRAAHRTDLTQIIATCFATLDADAVVTRLDTAGIGNARVRGMAELWSHPQLAARNRWRNVASPQGPLPALLPAAGGTRMDPIPALGADTDRILAELGYNPAGIETLRAGGAI